MTADRNFITVDGHVAQCLDMGSGALAFSARGRLYVLAGPIEPPYALAEEPQGRTRISFSGDPDAWRHTALTVVWQR